MRHYLKKTHHKKKKIGLVVWLKVKALSSSPRTTKKKGWRKKMFKVYSFRILS
jgi:hypothetical protein